MIKRASLLLAFACTEEVSFQTAEDARAQARENAQHNALAYRAQNPVYKDHDIYMRGDSTISVKCPQGDGWASVDLRLGQKTVKLKCSTVSGAIGCMTSSDFKTKVYAQEDGKCSKEIPHPLPKLKV